jgi:hypothetical protein
MVGTNGQSMPLIHGADSVARPATTVIPANGPGGCACGSQGEACTCEKGGSSRSRFIYVLGTVDIRFPDQSISEELETVARTSAIPAQSPNESLRHYYHRVLSLKTADGRLMARHVARQVCWILKVEGQIAYCLTLRDLDDLPDLISCLNRPEPGDHLQPGDDPEDYLNGEGHGQYHVDLDLFVGTSSLIPVDTSPGVTAPVLVADQFCSFKKREILGWCATASDATRARRRQAPAASPPDPERLFRMLVQSADNLGDSDEWRALNYLAVRYKYIYQKYAEMADNYALVGIKVLPSRLWKDRRIVDPVFAFQNKTTAVVQKFFVRVDVTYLFPMIITQLSEYFDR